MYLCSPDTFLPNPEVQLSSFPIRPGKHISPTSVACRGNVPTRYRRYSTDRPRSDDKRRAHSGRWGTTTHFEKPTPGRRMSLAAPPRITNPSRLCSLRFSNRLKWICWCNSTFVPTAIILGKVEVRWRDDRGHQGREDDARDERHGRGGGRSVSRSQSDNDGEFDANDWMTFQILRLFTIDIYRCANRGIGEK